MNNPENQNAENQGIQQEAQPVIAEDTPQESQEVLAGGKANEGKTPIWKQPFYLKIGAGILAGVLVIAIVIGIFVNSASVNLKKAVANTMKAAASSETVTFLKSVLTQGSVELALDLENLTEDLRYGYYDVNIEGELSAKYIINQNSEQMALILALVNRGNTLANAALYKTKDAIVLDSNLLPGKSALGIGLKNFNEKLKASIFNPDKGSYYSFSPYFFDQLLEMDLSSTDKYKEYVKLAEKVAGKALDTLYDSLKDNLKTGKEKDTLQFGGRAEKVTVLTMHGDAKQAAAVYKEMLQWVRESADIKKLLEQTAELYGPVLEEMYYYDAESFVEEIYEGLDMVLEDFDEIEDMFERQEAGLTFNFYISKKSKELVKIDLILHSSDEVEEIELTFGPSLKDIELISLEYTHSSSWSDSKNRYTYSFEVEENTASTYKAALRSRQNTRYYKSNNKATIEWDKKGGDLSIVSDDIKIKGSMDYSKGALNVNIKSIKAGYSELEPGLGLTLKQKDSVPKATAYTDVLGMNENAIDDLIYEVYYNIMDLAFDLGIPESMIYNFLMSW